MFRMIDLLVREVQEDGVGMPIPSKLVDLLDNFADKMLDKLPKVLPPRALLIIL